MPTDAKLKRFFPAVVLALIGAAAYFQASGMGQLIGASTAPSSVPAAAAPGPRPLAPPASTHTPADTLAILSRNPFDSVTGPLDKERPPPPPVQGEDETPACTTARVLLITWSEDARWSFASIAGADGKSKLRRAGDEVNGYTIEEIEWDRVRMTSISGGHCEAAIGGKTTPVIEAKQRQDEGDKKKKVDVPESITSRIHRIDDTHFTVERSVIGEIIAQQAALLGKARVAPGKDGVKLLGVRSGSLLDFLGMENGDRLQSVNGIDVSDTAALVKAYQGLLTAEHLTVAVVRREKPMSIDVTVK